MGLLFHQIPHIKRVIDKQCRVNGRICGGQFIFLLKSESVESQDILSTEGTSSKP